MTCSPNRGYTSLVRRQYSGNAHGIIKGIGLVNCVYVNPETGQFWLLDYHLFTLESDGKTKLDHVADRLRQLGERHIPYRIMLMDSWYTTTALFKKLTEAGKYFYCPLKSNRRVDDSGGQQPYQPIALLTWSAADVAHDKCTVPGGDGVPFDRSIQQKLWEKYFTAAAAQLRQYNAVSNVVRKASKR